MTYISLRENNASRRAVRRLICGVSVRRPQRNMIIVLNSAQCFYSRIRYEHRVKRVLFNEKSFFSSVFSGKVIRNSEEWLCFIAVLMSLNLVFLT